MRIWEGATVPQYGLYQVSLRAAEAADPYGADAFGAVFARGGEAVRIPGFYDGEGQYRVRFMPEAEGEWTYETYGCLPELAGHRGAFICTAAESRGPVRVADKYRFAYADGTKCFPYGTTCYAWTYQDEARRAQTVETMRHSPFNKLRMCVFPKSYLYNHAEPRLYPYEKSGEGFDLKRFNPAFFRDFEEQMARMQEIGVETDIILFHPYDRWGFSAMGMENDLRYLRYFLARVAALRGTWWAMANEFDIMRGKTDADWDALGAFVAAEDPYRHLISIHNCMRHFDHTKPWVTHASVQRVDTYRTTEDALDLRAKWDKPIVFDEICYEGNIPSGWGNIDGEELTRRYWEAAIRESYPGHGETFIDYDKGEDQWLWWSHGGTLVGESPARIRFLRDIVEGAPDYWTYKLDSFDLPAAHIGCEYYIFYHGLMCPCGREYPLPAGYDYRVEVIDTWEMTVEDRGVFRADPPAGERFFWPKDERGNPYGMLAVKLPGKRYIAVRITRV